MECDEHQYATTAAISMAGHFAAVRRDLSHVRELLRDAVSGLLTNALALRQAASVQIDVGDARDAERIALAQAVRQHADATVVSLQFEDMAAQLLDHVHGHIDRLESLVQENLTPGEQPIHVVAVEAPFRPPVACRELQPGDIELF